MSHQSGRGDDKELFTLREEIKVGGRVYDDGEGDSYEKDFMK